VRGKLWRELAPIAEDNLVGIAEDVSCPEVDEGAACLLPQVDLHGRLFGR
jgi:hypothetical protein